MEKTKFLMIKRSRRVIFTKTKKLFCVYDIEVDKILISKNKPMVKKVNSNTFLDIMMMMLLDLYV